MKRKVQSSGRVWPKWSRRIGSIRGLGPHKGIGAGGLGEVGVDRGLQIGDRAEDIATDALRRHFAEEILNGIEPKWRGRGELKHPARVRASQATSLGCLCAA